SLTRGDSQPHGFSPDPRAVAPAALSARVGRVLLAVAALLSMALPVFSEPVREASNRVPVAAQGVISGSLGRNDASYHASPTPLGLLAENQRHGFSIGFSH